MRSVVARFRLVERANPGHSSLIVFGRTVKGQNFNHRTVAFYFPKLVDKADYSSDSKLQLIRFYTQMSKAPKEAEDGKNRPLNCLPSPYQLKVR